MQAAKRQIQQLEVQLDDAQGKAETLQARLDEAAAAKQEADATCLQMSAEVQSLQQQLRCARQTWGVCQSQQLELQVRSSCVSGAYCSHHFACHKLYYSTQLHNIYV